MKRIAALGVFAMRNPGSVLIGDVLKSELERRLDGSRVDLYSLADTPLSSIAEPWDFTVTERRGYTIRPFKSAESAALVERLVAEYDVVLLGGDTLWTPHHPWPGLFWLDDERLVNSSLTILSHAVCIREPFHFVYDDRGIDFWRRRFGRLCARLQYISVRDLRSRQTLEDLGVGEPVHVVPEPVLLYEKQDNAGVQALLGSLGLDRSRPLVGVTVTSELASVRSNFLDELIAGLRHLRDARNAQILAFPYSAVHHQREGMALVRDRLEGVVALEALLDPWDTYDLIGELDLLVVFPGFHAAVAAIAQGVPVLTADIYTSRPNKQLKHPRYVMGPCTKILQLVQTFNLEESYANPYVHFEPDVVRHRLDFLLSSPRDLGPRLAAVRREIAAHFDRLAELIRGAEGYERSVAGRQLSSSAV